MSLSNSVKTHLLDPTVMNNSRAEFRLPEGYLASTLKLVDLGVYDTNATAASGLYYPHINGCLAAINKLSLFADGLLIDEIQELQSLGAIRSLQTTNQGQEDIHRFELQNGANIGLSEPGVYSYGSQKQTGGWDSDYYARDSGDVRRHNYQVQVASASIDQQSGCLLLNQYLEFLNSVQVLPNLPNLRLVIEWKTTASDFYNDGSATTPVVTPTVLPIRPTLIVDEIIGAPEGRPDVEIPFLANIVERFVVSAVADGVTKLDTFRSGAFKARHVKDLTFYNKVTASDSWWLAKNRSPAMHNEVIQLVLNGSTYLPAQGIDQEATKLQYFNDTQGPLNLCTASWLDDVVDGSGNVVDDNTIKHNFSVTSVGINQVIERLDIQYTRTGNSVYGSTQQKLDQVDTFTLLCFGRVAKKVSMRGGVLKMQY
jgi:hypothetical protein